IDDLVEGTDANAGPGVLDREPYAIRGREGDGEGGRLLRGRVADETCVDQLPNGEHLLYLPVRPAHQEGGRARRRLEDGREGGRARDAGHEGQAAVASDRERRSHPGEALREDDPGEIGAGVPERGILQVPELENRLRAGAIRTEARGAHDGRPPEV